MGEPPVKGAATYAAGKDVAGKNCVYMTDDEGHTSIIQYYPNAEKAVKGAYKWQQKENKSVLKSQKK